jgi:hypothetical protein
MPDEKNYDSLGLAGNKGLRTMLSKLGDNSPSPETVKYSAILTKVIPTSCNYLQIVFVCQINKRNKAQVRAILITDKAIYNMKPNSYSSCQRRVNLSLVVGVTSSRGTGFCCVLVVSDLICMRFGR